MLLEIMCIFKGKKIVRKHKYYPVFHILRPTKANSSKKYLNSFYQILSQTKKHYISETTFISNTTGVNRRMLPSSFQVRKISSSKSGLSNLKHQWKHKDVTVPSQNL